MPKKRKQKKRKDDDDDDYWNSDQYLQDIEENEKSLQALEEENHSADDEKKDSSDEDSEGDDKSQTGYESDDEKTGDDKKSEHSDENGISEANVVDDDESDDEMDRGLGHLDDEDDDEDVKINNGDDDEDIKLNANNIDADDDEKGITIGDDVNEDELEDYTYAELDEVVTNVVKHLQSLKMKEEENKENENNSTSSSSSNKKPTSLLPKAKVNLISILEKNNGKLLQYKRFFTSAEQFSTVVTALKDADVIQKLTPELKAQRAKTQPKNSEDEQQLTKTDEDDDDTNGKDEKKEQNGKDEENEDNNKANNNNNKSKVREIEKGNILFKFDIDDAKLTALANESAALLRNPKKKIKKKEKIIYPSKLLAVTKKLDEDTSNITKRVFDDLLKAACIELKPEAIEKGVSVSALPSTDKELLITMAPNCYVINAIEAEDIITELVERDFIKTIQTTRGNKRGPTKIKYLSKLFKDIELNNDKASSVSCGKIVIFTLLVCVALSSIFSQY